MQTKNPSTVLTGDGDSLVSLGNLFQVLNVIILSITFFFHLKLSLNLFPAICCLLHPQWKRRAFRYSSQQPFVYCTNVIMYPLVDSRRLLSVDSTGHIF